MTFRSDDTNYQSASKSVAGIVAITVVILVVSVILFGLPLAIIWCLNTLFPVLAIEYRFESWIAMFVLYKLFKIAVRNTDPSEDLAKLKEAKDDFVNYFTEAKSANKT